MAGALWVHQIEPSRSAASDRNRISPRVIRYFEAYAKLEDGLYRNAIDEGCKCRGHGNIVAKYAIELPCTLPTFVRNHGETPAGSFIGMVTCALLQGVGFGVCWPSIIQRVVKCASEDERVLAAAAPGTLQRVGYAVGAAITGISANASGLADGMTPTAAREAGFWVFAAFLPVLAIGTISAWHFTSSSCNHNNFV